MTTLPRFLIVRFPPGGAGNMLISLLQASPEVAHWDPQQEDQKPNNNWLEYFSRVFQPNMEQWLYREPVGQLSWGTRKIFSAKYPRGNDLSVADFLAQEQQHCNDYYHAQKNAGKYLPIFWHKSIMPEYFRQSLCAIIQLDQASLRWFDRAVYHKHYKIVRKDCDQLLIQNLENRPEIVPKQFGGQVIFEQSWPSLRAFVIDKIYNNPYRALYQQPDQIAQWSIPSIKINLSQLLSTDLIYSCYLSLCDHFNITAVLSSSLVQQLHQYWRRLHAF